LPPIVHDVLQSPGQPLDQDTRAFMESRFGRDFSHVRVRTDAKAAVSASAVNALAFTVGQNMVFGAGQYQPETTSGKRLLAHELTHTIQQSSGSGQTLSRLSVSPASDATEREADTAARLIMDESVYQPQTRVAARVARQEKKAAEPQAAAPAVEECPKTITIPDNVYTAIAEAWKKSGHGGATVAEHGGRVVTDKDKKQVIRTGSGGGGSMAYPAEQPGDVTESTFHTHPYSKSEDSELGVSFSSDDIKGFIGGTWGKTQFVGAGSCIFALDTLNQTKRDACKTVDTTKRWDDQFAKAGGSFQDKVIAAVKASIAGCGICHYKACRPNEKSAAPKTAQLV
jgi:hypothetical protein